MSIYVHVCNLTVRMSQARRTFVPRSYMCVVRKRSQQVGKTSAGERLFSSSLTPDDLQLLLSGNGSAMCFADFRKSVSFRDMRAESVRQSETIESNGPARLRAFESSFWEALASMSEMELLKLAEFWTANVVALPAKPTAGAAGQSGGIGGGMVVNLVDLEHNGKGGEVTMITARTCTNELTVPDYGVSGRELAQRLLRLLEAYEVLPQFDTI